MDVKRSNIELSISESVYNIHLSIWLSSTDNYSNKNPKIIYIRKKEGYDFNQQAEPDKGKTDFAKT